MCDGRFCLLREPALPSDELPPLEEWPHSIELSSEGRGFGLGGVLLAPVVALMLSFIPVPIATLARSALADDLGVDGLTTARAGHLAVAKADQSSGLRAATVGAWDGTFTERAWSRSMACPPSSPFS